MINPHRDVFGDVTDVRGTWCFGDASLDRPTATTTPDSWSLQLAARRHRSRIIGALVASTLRAAVTWIRGRHERYRHQVSARAAYRELAALDDRTLHDLGIHHRSELPFVAQRLIGGDGVHELYCHH